jgi:hypothetical protein
LEKILKFDAIQPRFLRYRNHYKIYFILLLTFSGLILSFWGHRLSQGSFQEVYQQATGEFWFSVGYFLLTGIFYFCWLRTKLDRSLQVFEDHILLHKGQHKEELFFAEVESVSIVGLSLFYFKMQNGVKHYFSSSIERVDYVWEGLKAARPDLFQEKEFEGFLVKLVQYDHHQKRKEWFFRHKMVDVFNWIVLPSLFLLMAYAVQTRDIVIHQQGLYFFRLFMYATLVVLITTSLFSLILKRLIFDRKIKSQMNGEELVKIRDLEFEGIVVERSKLMQMVSAAFVFSLIIRADLNLFSLTRIKQDMVHFSLRKGHSVVVDNRFNCVSCKYQLQEGDVVMFGRGTIGQILAREGEMVAQVAQDKRGRVIASDNSQAVPAGHVAVRVGTSELAFVKISDLVGKLQN